MQIISFHNPSVRDYLEQEVIWQHGFADDLSASLVFFEQCILLWEITKSISNNSVRLVSQCPVLFVEAMQRTYQESGCKYARPSQGVSLGEKLSIHERSLAATTVEERVIFTAKVADILEAPNGKDILQNMIDVISGRVTDKKSTRQPLVQLITDNKVKKICNNFPSMTLLDATQLLLLDEPEDFEDYEAISDFIKSFPDRVSDDELDDVRFGLYSWIDSYLDDASDNDDPSEIGSYMDSIRIVADILKANVNTELRQLKQICTEIEHKSAQQGEEYGDDDRYALLGSHYPANEDASIRAMFGSLTSS